MFASTIRRWRRQLLKWFNNECRLCGYPRAIGRAYCSENCAAEFRRREAIQRGYAPTDDWSHTPRGGR
jgi:hypothetical protein